VPTDILPLGEFISTWVKSPYVVTVYGALKGEKDKSKTYSWRGIPYARPPVGELRWKAPRSIDQWRGVFEATVYGSPCAQPAIIREEKSIGDEDCLSLNIWRPRSNQTGLPVYVWIHGGGNTTGSGGILPDYNGANFSGRENLVFVSVNYRLGPFGWFLHDSIMTGEETDDLDRSGNFGTLDIIYALQWIQENIEAFGGDPENVTLAGQSAGGANVLSLFISPLAKGLYHRAVCQSGLPITASPEEGRDSAERVRKALVENDTNLGYMTGLWSQDSFDYLRSKSAEELLTHYNTKLNSMLDFPYIFRDGTVIPREGFAVLDQGELVNNVPLMIGSNKDEFSLFLEWSLYSRGERNFFRQSVAMGSSLWRADGVDEIARIACLLPDAPPVYAYSFQWGGVNHEGYSVLPGRYRELLGAAHALDIPFFFGNQTAADLTLAASLFNRRNRKGREKLSGLMMDYLGNYAWYGDPNGEDLPAWLPWDRRPGGAKSIVLDADYKTTNVRMSIAELYRDDILEYFRGAMPEEEYDYVLDRVFWR
jgi:para-nitrobenzyl esterase